MDRPCGGLLADPNVSERLDALYGAEPRRIYGALVLADAGASISEYRGTILRVSAAVAPDAQLADELCIRPRLEPTETLLLWADRPGLLRSSIGDNTWLSMPERAVLEAVDARDVTMYPLEIAAKALAWGLAGTAERIIAAAEELRCDRAMRMLRSLAAALKNRIGDYPVPTPTGILHPEYDILAEPTAPAPTGDWLIIDDLEQVNPALTHHDHANRVAWVDTPEYTIDNVLH